MRTTRIVGAAALLFGAGALAMSPMACGGGGGGGLGLGIATIGVSAIFAGNSPGWCVRDPNLATPTTGGGTLNVSPTAESPFPTLAAGETLDRVIVSGGAVRPPVTVVGVATGTTATSLQCVLLYTGWQPFTGLGSTVQIPLATSTVSIGATATAFTLTLDFTHVTVGNAVYTNFTSNPGDLFNVRLSNAGSGTITIDPTQTRLNFLSGQTRQTRALLVGNGSNFSVVGDVQLVESSNSSSASQVLAASPTNVTTSAGQSTVLKTLVTDNQGNPVSGAVVTYSAPGATVPSGTATSGANGLPTGIASATLIWTSSGPQTVTATVSGGTKSATFTVNVTSQSQRQFDGLESFVVQSDGVTLTGSVNITVDPICVTVSAGFGNIAVGNSPGKTTIPSNITYKWGRDVTSTSDWRYSLQVRTRSLTSTATCVFQIIITNSGTGAVVAQSPTMTAQSVMQPFTGTLTEVSTVALSFVPPGSGTTANGAMRIGFLTSSSSDITTPGIEVITDPTNPAVVNLPGPVVFSTTSSTFLTSVPDPRR